MADWSLQGEVEALTYPPVPSNFGANYCETIRQDTYDYIDPVTKSDCKGKAVLITGGNKGIGKGVALSYARAGASHIAITSRSDAADVATSVEKAAIDAGRERPVVMLLRMDVSDPESVKDAAHALEANWGRLDVLIGNAGFLAKYERILDGDEDEWWKSFEVNVRGSYLVAKAFLPLMLKGGDKTIISMSSTGVSHFHTGGSSYQISKLALLRLTEYLMAEYAEQDILTYSIHPGGVATDLARGLPQQTQAWLKCTPALGGDTIAFLTSQRQTWLAGRYISAMWDMCEFFSKKDEIIAKDSLKMKMTF
ncbi:NAD(P)-binding protein [Annulohypoxylon maeteangense]|uniref:NAD(P)-binding protein n=1 Tax=Annulohypoxylon maeteangense TaxID=1927788 RepID=UPI002008E2D9|nr:NAD(P)-binding protein [Annulohypoxylon maeteangense]KAI0882377.1 NAD(P)-binding protein [Annulohypoxylon maeteangense]